MWGRHVTADGRLIGDIGSIADGHHTLVAVDPATGGQTILLRSLYGTRNFWPQYSTDGALALGYDYNPPEVLDAATLDPATGKITEHGLHITFIP
jgi:hypothetical protein